MTEILGALIVLLYISPGFLAAHRRHPSGGAIFLLTILLGWTGIGWVAALIWAASGPRGQDVAARDTIPCPYCREPILRGAVICKHCRSRLDGN
jgi:hypothetical protein